MITAATIHVCYLLILFNLATVLTHHPVPELLSSKQQEFYQVAYKEKANSLIQLNRLEGTTISLIENIPAGFGVTLLRPYLGESKNPLILIAAIENAAILLFIIFCLIGFSMKGANNKQSVFYVAIYFSVIMFVLIGLVTPILGAVVRYKVPALSFLLFGFFCLTNKRWVKYCPAKIKSILFH